MKPALRLRLLVLSFGLLLGESLAVAGPASAADAQARDAFAKGEQLFKGGRYAEAIAAFEEGNRQKPHPAFLFDLALTYRAMGDPGRAIDYYRQYLKAKPDAEDRAAIEASIAEEQAKLKAAGSAPAPTSPPVLTPASTPAPAAMAAPAPAPTPALAPEVAAVTAEKEAGPSPAKSDRPIYQKWWFWTATGVGVAAVAIGLGVGLSQSGKDPYQEVIWR